MLSIRNLLINFFYEILKIIFKKHFLPGRQLPDYYPFFSKYFLKMIDFFFNKKIHINSEDDYFFYLNGISTFVVYQMPKT